METEDGQGEAVEEAEGVAEVAEVAEQTVPLLRVRTTKVPK